jgi:cephalosporin-C deacetylase-like acetyl esterase
MRGTRSMIAGLVLMLATAGTQGSGLEAQEVRTGSAPVPTDLPALLTDEFKAELAKWAEDNPREGVTALADWYYQLPPGVRTEQVTYYSNEQPAYAKIFYPADFSPTGSWPAVVLGHGFNGISLSLEKYGARFADRGLVAMVIDYRTYGFSDPWVRLLDRDLTRDGQDEVITRTRAELIRTRMHTPQQAEDFRAAISYIQGEPGVDPDRIGIWGSSQGAAVVFAVAAQDSRVGAVVAQIPPSAAWSPW